MSDFYEDDEPTADVVAAFDAGEKQLTGPGDWRTKRDEDLTRDDLAEMRKLAQQVRPRGPRCDQCHGTGRITKSLTVPGGYGMTVSACPNGCPQPYLMNGRYDVLATF